jgi:hypothetical protein
MTGDEINLAVRARHENRDTPRAIRYPDWCTREAEMPKSGVFDERFEAAETFLDLILEHEEVKCLPMEEKKKIFQEFTVLIRRTFRMPDIFLTLASWGHGLLHYTGCFEGVYELRGPPYEFIRKCLHPAIIQAKDNKPIKVEGLLMQIDRRGSYTAIYRDFEGIPMGKPVHITCQKQWDMEKWDYYYVCVEISELKRDSYGYDLNIHEGLNYLDKAMFEHAQAHMRFKFKFVSGYGFNQGFNTKIRDVAVKLWELRMSVKGRPVEKIMKRLMNSLWGKSIAKIWDVKVRTVEDNKMRNVLVRNEGFVYEMHRTGEAKWQVALARPIVKAFRMPQFGINVLSSSIVQMREIISNCNEIDVPVFYTNTDCLLLKQEDLPKLKAFTEFYDNELLGEGLGQFSDEFKVPSRKFICLSKKKYLHCFVDETFRVRFPPKNVEEKDLEAWFEKKYLEKNQ